MWLPQSAKPFATAAVAAAATQPDNPYGVMVMPSAQLHGNDGSAAAGLQEGFIVAALFDGGSGQVQEEELTEQCRCGGMGCVQGGCRLGVGRQGRRASIGARLGSTPAAPARCRTRHGQQLCCSGHAIRVTAAVAGRLLAPPCSLKNLGTSPSPTSSARPSPEPPTSDASLHQALPVYMALVSWILPCLLAGWVL